jgi:Domain of unknown function (DUF4167)
MRPNQQKNRSRGRNGGRKHINPLSRNFESNGPDVKVRGNAAHIAEKYLQLARDAQSSGDSVMAENYLQHAEHYFRIVSAAQPQGLPRADGTYAQDPDADDEDDFPPINDRFSSPEPRIPAPIEQPQGNDAGEYIEPQRAPEAEQTAQAPQGEGGETGEQRRHRDRRPRRRNRGGGEGGNGPGNTGGTGGSDPSGAPQPEVGELPAFITAGGATTVAE